MSMKDLISFYDLTFTNNEIQSKLIDKDKEEFIQKSISIALASGLSFTEEEMLTTMNGLKAYESENQIDFGDEWINKIMSLGWTPKGYSRV